MFIDLRGLKCPLPVLRTRKALRAAAPGDTLEVACTDPLAELDIANLARETGDTLLGARRDGETVTLVLRKAARDPA